MNGHHIGPVTAPDLPALLALNNTHAAELSWLEMHRLQHLTEQAFMARQVDAQALLLAFDQAADYDSPNFLWFRERYQRFVYIDRVVVAASLRGRGIARTLYRTVFEAAERSGHDKVVCEVNIEPPNPGSDAFHAVLGFQEIGTAAIHGGQKTVRYLARALASQSLSGSKSQS